MSYLAEPNKYPKKIYIKNETYRIVFTDKIEHYGDTDPVKNLIRIRAGMSRRETFNTFVHELIHAMEFTHNIKLKHKAVYKLERAIVELLVDNFL
jgi:hypothetical protein